jgi:tape measure domain-containing protein
MSGSRPTVAIRVTAENADKTRSDLERIGTSGEAAMRRVQNASAAATPEMQRLAGASDIAQRAFTGLGGSLGRFGGLATGASAGASALAAGFLAVGAAAGVAAVNIARAGDTATATLARLTSATGSLQQAEGVYARLFALSQQTGVAVTESAGSFARFAVAAREIGGTTDQVLRLVGGIQKAGIVAGTSAQEAGAAVQQLGQALASGTLQGDELRSVLENMPQFAQALARELGVGIGHLRQMGSEGKLTADVVFPAMLRAAEGMSAEFDKMPVTMSRAKDILLEATQDFGARLDRITGLSQTFARFMQEGASALGAAGRAIAPTEREAASSAVERARGTVGRVADQIAADRAASAYGTVSPALAQAMEIAEADLQDATRRLGAILQREGEQIEMNEEQAARRAIETRRQRLSVQVGDISEAADRRVKIEREAAEKLATLAKAEAEGMNVDAARAAVIREKTEALEKLAGATTAVGRAAEEADAHVRAFLKDQTAQAEAAAKAQEKAAEAIKRYHERSFNELVSIGERAFDRLGDALVDAFVSGQGAAVNFGNVARGIAASLVADFAKLAIINPILNSVFTSSTGPRPTLSAAFGGSATGFGGIGQMLGLGQMLGGESIGAALGLTGAGGLLGTTIIGGIGPATGAALGGMGGALGPASLSQLNATGLMGFGGSGATFGQLLGGAGAGFGAGMMLNSLLGGNQTSGMIGSGLGSGLGALLGSLTPLGPLGGALIGGLLGGGGGGMFGPGPSVQAWSYGLRAADPNPAFGDAFGSRLEMDNVFFNESGAQQFQAANASIAQINEFLAARGLTVRGARAVSGNNRGPDGVGAASFNDAFATFQFGAQDNAGLAAGLSGRSFGDPAALQAFVDGFLEVDALIRGLTADAVPAFTARITAVNDNFEAVRKRADELGVSMDGLADAQARAIGELEANRTEQLRASSASLEVRRLRAVGMGQDADLLAQAEAASAELRSFGDALDALAITAEDRANRLVQLEEVQAAERAAIVARWGEQTNAALRQGLQSGESLMRDLAFGAASPLAPEQQYFAAMTSLNQARQALDAGGSLSDYTSIASQVLPVARDYLGTSQRYGGLVAEIGQVLASRGADSAGLSQIMAAQVNSTDAMSATLASLSGRQVEELVGLRREVARLAAHLEATISRQAAA